MWISMKLQTYKTQPKTEAVNYTLAAFVMPRIMKDYAKTFYKSAAWLHCRDGYIKSVGGLCERCLSKGLIVPGYIVHHKCYLTPNNILDPDVSLNWNNLEYLCHDCHNKEHFKDEYLKRYKIKPDGSVEVL